MEHLKGQKWEAREKEREKKVPNKKREGKREKQTSFVPKFMLNKLKPLDFMRLVFEPQVPHLTAGKRFSSPSPRPLSILMRAQLHPTQVVL